MTLSRNTRDTRDLGPNLPLFEELMRGTTRHTKRCMISEEGAEQTSSCRQREQIMFERFVEGELTDLSRLSISSDAWHRAHPTMSKRMFGMDWSDLKPFLNLMFEAAHEDPTPERMNMPLTEFEEGLMSLLMMEQSTMRCSTIARYFQCNEVVAKQVLMEWTPEWDEVARQISNPPFEDDLLEQIGYFGDPGRFKHGFPKGIFRNCVWKNVPRGASAA